MNFLNKALWIVLSMNIANVAKAEPDFNKLGKLGYAQWECAALAGIANEHSEDGLTLFEKGYQKFDVFVRAWLDGKLTSENTNEVPIGVRWYLVSGPSADFSLGYMWAQFQQQVYDKTWDADVEGSFDELEELQTLKADTLYRERNCVLLAE